MGVSGSGSPFRLCPITAVRSRCGVTAPRTAHRARERQRERRWVRLPAPQPRGWGGAWGGGAAAPGAANVGARLNPPCRGFPPPPTPVPSEGPLRDPTASRCPTRWAPRALFALSALPPGISSSPFGRLLPPPLVALGRVPPPPHCPPGWVRAVSVSSGTPPPLSAPRHGGVLTHFGRQQTVGWQWGP